MNEKIQSSIKLLNDMESLIGLMESEIRDLRYMVYRYQLMYGEQVKGGNVELSEDISFTIHPNEYNENATVTQTDLSFTNYKRIKEYLSKIK